MLITITILQNDWRLKEYNRLYLQIIELETKDQIFLSLVFIFLSATQNKQNTNKSSHHKSQIDRRVNKKEKVEHLNFFWFSSANGVTPAIFSFA